MSIGVGFAFSAVKFICQNMPNHLYLPKTNIFSLSITYIIFMQYTFALYTRYPTVARRARPTSL